MDLDSLVGRVFAQYRVMERLGAGGMGVVYLAEDTRLQRKVALKFIRTEASPDTGEAARFIREAQAAAALNNPHITTVYDIGQAQGRLFIAMEFLEGKTLRDELADKPLDLSRALDYAVQAADGLQAAHEKGIVHRDIKSANLMVSPNGTVKITDFGLARLGGDSQATRTGAMVGTVAYMSPEQASGEAVDQRTDIWAFGVVLFEMVTGRRPFAGGNERATLNAILTADPPSLTRLRRDLPLELERIIDKCLEKKPERRYQTAAELKGDLNRLSQAVSSRTRTLEGTGLPRPGLAFYLKRNRRRLLSVLGVLVVLAGAAILVPPLRTALGRWLGFGPASSQISVAVLPFDVVGGNDDDRAYCQGLAEILNGRLSLVERLQGSPEVVPAVDIRQLDRPSAEKTWFQYHANRALTGMMVFVGDKVKITVNLVEAPRFRQLESQTFDVARDRLGDLLDSVSGAAVRFLDLSLKPETYQAWASHDACKMESYVQAVGYLAMGSFQWQSESAALDAALNLFQRSVDKDPRCAVAFAGLSEACRYEYERTSDKTFLDRAQEAAQRALGLNKDLNRDLAEVHITLGNMYRSQGRNDQSVRELQLALSLDPKNEEAFRLLGYTYEELGELGKAEKAYRQAVALKPTSWTGYSYLGLFYYSHGRFAEAEKNFLKVRELTPDNWQGFNYLGAIYLQTGRIPEAINMFAESLNLFPTAAASSNLGTAYFYSQQYAEAAAMYEKAISLGGKDVALWGNLGDAYRFVPGAQAKAKEAYVEAIRLAKKGLELNPMNGDLHSTIARYYALIGDCLNALAEVEAAGKLLPGNTIFFEVSVQVYELCGRRDKALEALRGLVKLRGSLELVEVNPDLADLRRDPRYGQIVKGAK